MTAIRLYLRPAASEESVFARLRSMPVTLPPWLLVPLSIALSRRSIPWRLDGKGLHPT
jgi:hypothetical protein